MQVQVLYPAGSHHLLDPKTLTSTDSNKASSFDAPNRTRTFVHSGSQVLPLFHRELLLTIPPVLELLETFDI